MKKTTNKVKLAAAAMMLGSLAVGSIAPTNAAQPVAGGVIVEYNNLDVALVANGWSVLKVLRGNVYNGKDEFVGYVHDAIVLPDGSTSFVIVNVAGFLNIGQKLVALPVKAFGVKENGNLVLPNATKDNLKALPRFIYN